MGIVIEKGRSAAEYNRTWYAYRQSIFSSPMPPHVLMNVRGFPPGCGDSVADFWGWDAHEARLRCPDDVSGDMPKSTNYPDHGHHGNFSLQGKIPMVEPGIEPGTSWLVVRDPDH